MSHDPALLALLEPTSVALVGASNRQTSFMSRPLRFLAEWKFPGAVYPVNSRVDEIDGQRCYASMRDLPGPIDLAVIMVGAGQVLAEVKVAAAAGARAAIVFSSGFAEAGTEGTEMEAELVRFARDNGMRILGPNSQGLINSRSRLAATFTSSFDARVEGGSVAYIGQSGALGGVVMSRARQYGLSIGTWITTGNQADLDVVTMAKYAAEQDDISTALLYLEQIPDFDSYSRLLEVASEKNKSLVVLRAGASEAGARVVAGHTGSLVSDSRAFELLSDSRGVQLAHDLDDFIAAGVGLGLRPMAIDPRPSSRRIAIATTSGGAGSLAADAADEAGLEVGTPSEVDALRQYLPAFASPANPLDLTGQFFMQAEPDLTAVVTGLADSAKADGLLVIITNIELGLARNIVEALRPLTDLRLPVAVCWLGANDDAWRYASENLAGQLPIFDTVRAGVASLSAALRPEAPSRRDDASRTPFGALPRLPEGKISNADGYGFLTELGVRTPGHVSLRADDEYPGGLKGPLVVKANSPALVHKSDSGAVVLGVAEANVPDTVRVVREKARAVIGPQASLEIVVEEMADPGIEMIVGFTASADGYPPLIVLGLGGVAAELDPDVVSALVPVTPADVRRMVAALRHAPLFNGFRGAAPLDVDALAEAVSRLSEVVAADPLALRELELNPVLVHERGRGVTAVDFFAHVERSTS